jgi:NAD(P)-dependent dehydrogenase (short-subunit alcohol dehydrogenase family)
VESRIALVTGATSGIGGATAEALRKRGYVVYAAGRRADRLAALADDRLLPVQMDVTDDASLVETVERVIAEQGRIDVLVNNAGYGSLGAIEDTSVDEGRRQFEVNVFGAFRLIQLVLPRMREQRSGRIVNVSSAGGKIYSPLGGWYHGTKFALEGMSDSLRLEVAPFGIKVVIIEPGATLTEWGLIAADRVEKASGHGAYAWQAHALASSLRSESHRRRSTPASTVASVIATAREECPGAVNQETASWTRNSPRSLQRTSSASSATATWWSGRRFRAPTASPWTSDGGRSWKRRTAYAATTARPGARSQVTSRPPSAIPSRPGS